MIVPTRFMVVGLCVLGALLGGLSCNKSNSQTVADALEDRLTDALDFKDSEKLAGNPPPEMPGELHPQITDLDAPARLEIGDTIELRITPDTDTSPDVTHVALFVKGATTHLRVKAVRDTESGQIVLTGKLAKQPELFGGFSITVALLREDGQSGESTLWQLAIPDEEGHVIDIPVGLTCTLDPFSCSDEQMSGYLTQISSLSNCHTECESFLDLADPDGALYRNCHACCLREPLNGIGREVFVECQACLEEMGKVRDGEVLDADSARESSSQDWDVLQESLNDCVNPEAALPSPLP